MKTKQPFMRFFATLQLLVVTLLSWAYDVEIDGIYYNLSSSDKKATVTYATSDFNSYSGDVVIPKTIICDELEYNVVTIGGSAFYSCPTLISVVIPESVTEIKGGSFSGCSSLISINLPEGITSIGGFAFNGCSSLTSITIPGSVTTIGERAFEGCFGLTKAEFSSVESLFNIYFNNNSSYYGANPLYYANHLYINGEEVTELTIPESVKTISRGFFLNCSGLTSVTIPNSVTGIDSDAFRNCSGLTSINIPNSMKIIDADAFMGCSSLKKVSFASIESLLQINFKNLYSNPAYLAHRMYIDDKEVEDVIIPDDVTTISPLIFQGCYSLLSLTIGNSVRAIRESSFANCTELASVNIPQGLTTIESKAFENCHSINSLHIPQSVSVIGDGAFRGCSGLSSISVADNNPIFDSRNNCNALIETETNTLVLGCKNTVIPTDVTTIDSYAFNCSDLINIDLPLSVNAIKGGAFEGCSSLSSIVIPESITELGAAFIGCSSLTTVTMNSNCLNSSTGQFTQYSNFFGPQVENYVIGDAVTKIGRYAFTDCSNMKSIVIGSGVTFIGDDAFKGCSGLKRAEFASVENLLAIDFSNHNYNNPLSYAHHLYIKGEEITNLIIPSGITTIKSGYFKGCSFITSVDIPESIMSIDNYAFDGCSAISRVTLKSNAIVSKDYDNQWGINNIGKIFGLQVKAYILGDEVMAIGNGAFQSCSAINTFIIPQHVTSIGSSAFRDCTGLTSVTIGSSVTSIGSSAFYGCAGLTSIELPQSLVTIDDYAFYGCAGLTSIELPQSLVTIDDYAFYGCSGITLINIPEKVSSIGRCSFQDCSQMASVIIGSGVQNMYNDAFKGCSSLTHVTINSDAILSKDYQFYDNIATIFGSQVNEYTIGDDVKSIGSYAFYGCSNLPTFTLPNSLNTIGNYAFQGTTSLQGIAIPNSVTAIGNGAFYNSGALKAVHITDMAAWCGITFGENWNGYSDDEGFNLYLNNKKVTDLLIPKEATKVNPLAFYNCKDVEHIAVEEGNEAYDSRNECNAIVETQSNTLLKGCKNSTVPADVTDIADYAFLNSDGLTTVTFGSQMQSVGQQAFSGCRLRNVLVKNATPPTAYTSSFSEQTFYHTTLYIPTGSWDDYAYDNSWYRFINIRETATTEAQLTMQQAYTLMDANKFCYSVYDPVNDCIGTISTVSGIDENNPNHCWQVIEADGNHYLYNIGAKKFVASSADGSGLILSDEATSIDMEDGEDGIVMGRQSVRQWALVSNERMAVAQDVIDGITTGMQQTTLPQQGSPRYYDLNGRQLQQPKNGLNIVRTADGRIVKKVF